MQPANNLYVKIFNKILESGVFPSKWSVGVIIPVYKRNGDRKDCNNYRGITLLSCLGKLFTAIINNRLTDYCNTYNIIQENQAGFRSNYSTNDHIFSLKMIIDLFFSKKLKLYCVFVDYKKAFDMVSRSAMWHKLINSGISSSSKIYIIIKSMYQNIKSCVMKNSEKSGFFKCTAGVRQGENLSPLLFSLFINDIEKYMLDGGCKHLDFKDTMINNYLKLILLLYADDTVIFSNTAADLQKSLDILYHYCSDWKLEVNNEKTKVIIFRKRNGKEENLFTYGKGVLECVNCFKYLGVIFNSRGTFKDHKLFVKEKAVRAMFALLSKGKSLNLPIDIILELFDRTILPILSYGCETWGFENCEILNTVYTKFCKYCLV